MLGRSGFYGDVRFRYIHRLRYNSLHFRYIGTKSRLLGYYRTVNIPRLKAVFTEHSNYTLHKYLTINILIIGRRVREMVTYIPESGGAKQGVTDSMNQDVSIAVSRKPKRIVNTNAAKPQLATFGKSMYIISEAYSHDYQLNRFLKPSISNDRVKRNVWSRGLLWTVLIR